MATSNRNSTISSSSYKQVIDNTLQVIDDQTMISVQIYLVIIVRGCVSFSGVVSNCINVIVFLKMGLKDSMTVGLLALSFTDWLVTLLQLASCLCYLAESIYPYSPINLWSLGYFVFGWSINAVYQTSCWITVAVSLERCICVVLPFRVKQIFTRFRCALVILTIYILHICIYVPICVTHKMDWVNRTFSSGENVSSLVGMKVFTVILNEETADFEVIFDLFIGVSWLLLSHGLVMLSALTMIFTLKASTSIRGRQTAIDEVKRKSQRKGSLSNMTDRERRLIKVVLFLALNLILCSIPRYITLTVYHTLPGMNTGGQQNLSTVLWTLTAIFSTLGGSINFFVYLAINSKFRCIILQHKST